jgi:hypothetical protein
MAMPVPRAGFLHLGGELDAATVAAGVRVALGGRAESIRSTSAPVPVRWIDRL